MRKIKSALLCILVCLCMLLYTSAVFGQGTSSAASIDTRSTSLGLIKVKYTSSADKRVKLTIEKGKNKYVYNLKNGSSFDSFPLQMGSGEYKISILENIEGSKYSVVSTKTIKVELKNDRDVFLNSIQTVNWANSTNVTNKARELTIGAQNEEEKVRRIYNYIVSSIKYDFDKLDKVPSDYTPDTESTLESKKGICYDYSALFAGMLRSIGIPSKLVKGYTTNAKGYHAWNEVYIKSLGKWIVVDTTYDSQVKGTKIKAEMAKERSLYKKVNEY
ncbi:MAG: transglutaminase-like domain-containing protein [Clostridia bacterium]|nr:transglutaminase-like domain-containing protein [Clostridia bacterium]